MSNNKTFQGKNAVLKVDGKEIITTDSFSVILGGFPENYLQEIQKTIRFFKENKNPRMIICDSKIKALVEALKDFIKANKEAEKKLEVIFNIHSVQPPRIETLLKENEPGQI